MHRRVHRAGVVVDIASVGLRDLLRASEKAQQEKPGENEQGRKFHPIWISEFSEEAE
jgi:hypothetical protein